MLCNCGGWRKKRKVVAVGDLHEKRGRFVRMKVTEKSRINHKRHRGTEKRKAEAERSSRRDGMSHDEMRGTKQREEKAVKPCAWRLSCRRGWEREA
jgi:hypothetical protein